MSQSFQRGDDVRVANTAADEVALRFRGFVPVATNDAPVTSGVDYRDLQASAKEAGIPANQTAAELTAALDAIAALAALEDEQFALDASYEGVPE